jgi:hypothetical protein
VQAHEPLLAEEPELFRRVLLRLVHARGERRDPLLRDVARQVANRALIVGQIPGVVHVLR